MDVIERDKDDETAVVPRNTTPDSYAPVRYNAMKHGVLSTLTVLPHEDGAAFSALRAALVEEHQPLGPTELHLDEDLAHHSPPSDRVAEVSGGA